MDLVVKIVIGLGSLIVVLGLIGIMLGVKDLRSGIVNDNPTKTDKGIESIVMGFFVSAVSGSIAAAIVAALNAISF